ncbi:uncharacterized protein LOC127241518 [Andrographis paniculata]|uniref:uncharacterized protein LOC127241518 n=1 Tax=Andrographis paniculata TaxID=175694 RepID=UPI0021E8AF73|nr:uncharacterized protein LOC127241518 [Andrographis paniculata]XP_051116569.1 uncharacterized protein LOC127241518 [Andrographis paniculata]
MCERRMKSLSGVGLGLSLVFGCLLLALIAEIYYLLWCKTKTIHSTPHSHSHPHPPPNIIPQILTTCCTPTPLRLCSSTPLVHHPSKTKPPPNPIGTLPRFLFTITEETIEDLEEISDQEYGFPFHVVRRKQQPTTHLADLLQVLELDTPTPFLTPIGSPAPNYYTPPLTPTVWINNNNGDHQRLGQFFQVAEKERERDAAFNRMRASPPPTFKFLRDAEDKMIQRKKLMEEQNGGGDRDNIWI